MAGLEGRTVLVLCDAAASTGLGHFVRCTSLAAVLSARGAEVSLVLPEDSVPHAVERARDAGRQVHQGPWLEAVAAAARRTGSGQDGPVVIVDSYRVSGPWLTDLHRRLSAAGGLLAVIDDLADRSFQADLVLNQNVGAETLGYPGVDRVLAGPQHALLRPEFARHREQAMRALAELPDRPRRVLVLFGGTDATGMAMTGATAAAAAFPGAHVRVVAPASAGGAAPEPGGPITRLEHVEQIHVEMLAADLVLSAGGTTLWELCCLARPMAVVAVADNQQPTYDEMVRRAAILPAGRTPVRDAGTLGERLRRLVAPPGTLRSVAGNAARLTDGRGAERVATALAELRPSRMPQPGTA
jgi:UDP-2,4-diacetamido-2,4,6-trideoxy-beta-L-altropyranose hydrolase